VLPDRVHQSAAGLGHFYSDGEPDACSRAGGEGMWRSNPRDTAQTDCHLQLGQQVCQHRVGYAVITSGQPPPTKKVGSLGNQGLTFFSPSVDNIRPNNWPFGRIWVRQNYLRSAPPTNKEILPRPGRDATSVTGPGQVPIPML
jgi:hypothetical protein